MATAAQITANQANARRSTGPTSVEGKAKSAQNARNHGFTAKTLNISDAERADFETLQSELLTQTCPSGRLEVEIFQRILTHSWNLMRIETFESEILAKTDPMATPGPETDKLERYARYRRDLERSLYRAINELRKLQTERAALMQQHTVAIEAISKTTPLAEITRLTKQTGILFETTRPWEATEAEERFIGGVPHAAAVNQNIRSEMERRAAAPDREPRPSTHGLVTFHASGF
ncbi:hypothetical protein [uncultured Paludibaculum sp.]|uniref:hypothetical protein n=1 Tax=uncultured Paludibaculum sp. TaxID=1765020 RepID=UPI002AABDAC0|nr:hypothetical protein [uncultured Paludibaculum sp.]